MNELLETLLNSESVNKEEVQKALEESIEKKIDEKAEILAEQMLLEKMPEALREEKEKLIEEYDQKLSDFNEKILETIDDYIKLSVEKIEDNIRENLEKEISVEKSDALIESFESMILSGGVDVMKIKESFEDNSDASFKQKFTEAKAQIDLLRTQVRELREELLIKEAQEDLSVVESEKFVKLAELHKGEENFEEKLNLLKESVKSKLQNEVKEKPSKVVEEIHSQDVNSLIKESYQRFLR